MLQFENFKAVQKRKSMIYKFNLRYVTVGKTAPYLQTKYSLIFFIILLFSIRQCVDPQLEGNL